MIVKNVYEIGVVLNGDKVPNLKVIANSHDELLTKLDKWTNQHKSKGNEVTYSIIDYFLAWE